MLPKSLAGVNSANTGSGLDTPSFTGIVHKVLSRFRYNSQKVTTPDHGPNAENARLLQNLQIGQITEEDRPHVKKIYRKGTFSDQAMTEYKEGDSSLILAEQKEGKGFLSDYDSDSVRGQWDRDLGSPNHVTVGLSSNETGDLLGYLDGYACVSKHPDQREKYREGIGTYASTLAGQNSAIEARLTESPESIARIGTIGVSPDCQGKGIGKLLMYLWTLELLNKLQPRDNGNSYAVTSFRFNHFFPSADDKKLAEKFGDNIVNNAPSKKFFSKYNFQDIGFHVDTFNRIGTKFTAHWMHEVKPLYELALIARTFTEQTFQKNGVPMPAEWEERWEHATCLHGIGKHSNGKSFVTSP